MEIKSIALGVCAANCYIVSDENGNAAVIDPADTGDGLYSYLEDNNLKLSAVIVTHAHYDHIAGLTDLLKAAKKSGLQENIPVYVHVLDEKAMSDTAKNLSSTLFFSPYSYDGQVESVNDGDIISFGNICLKVMHTPGHTPGSACFIEQSKRIIFTGDTLFKGSCGRTDFDGGSTEQIHRSLKRIYNLEGDYEIYPGHEMSTTLCYERKNNSYMR